MKQTPSRYTAYDVGIWPKGEILRGDPKQITNNKSRKQQTAQAGRREER